MYQCRIDGISVSEVFISCFSDVGSLAENDYICSVNTEAENIANEIHERVLKLQWMGRNDLLLQSIGVPLLEQLRIEAAKGTLSPLRITADYRFFLTAYNNKEVELSPIHKAVYLLFLDHPEGIEFKKLGNYKAELRSHYAKTCRWLDTVKVVEAVDRLVDPLDNAINEKCSRIKNVFLSLMDEYSASYYIISSRNRRHIQGASHIWFERLKLITLPRNMVIYETKT